MNTRSLLVAVALATAVCGQSPAPLTIAGDATTALAFAEDLVLTDIGTDGTVWAAAAGWKASFAAAGTTFTPCFGPTAPSQPVTFRVNAARVGGMSLQTTAAAADLHERRVAFARGDLVEFYDLSPAGIEQQFRFDGLPCRGELQIDLAVETGLICERDGAGLLFSGPHGAVRYGAAVALDAAGRRAAVATRWDGHGLQLVVPAEFVAEATLPLLVDPMIGGSTPFSAAAVSLASADMAYDHSRDQYYVVYERAFSATDHDVYVAYLDANMNYVGLVTIDYTNQYWSRPRIAALENVDQICVVAEQSTGGVAPLTVALRRVTFGASVVVDPPYIQPLPSFAEYYQPVIGGDASPTGPSTFLIATVFRNTFSGDTDIKLWNVDQNGTTSFATFITTPGSADREPVISKTCGDRAGNSAAWAVVFRNEAAVTGTGQLRASIVSQSGPALRSFASGTSFDLGGSYFSLDTQWAVSSPTDHALGRRFLCVERPANLFQGPHMLVGHVFDGSGVVIHNGASIAGGNYDHRSPTVDCDGIRFGVAYSTHLTASDADLRCCTFGLVGNQLAQQDSVAPSYSLDYDAEPCLCARRGGRNGEYGLSWVRSNAAGFAVHAQRYLGIGAGSVTTRATGCGGLTASVSGLQWLGESITFTVSNSSGLPGFVVGLPASLPVGPCPGCTQGVSGSAVLGAAVTIAIPPDAGLVGLTLAAQAFRFAPSGQPCLGQIELSDTKDFTIR